MEGQDGVVAVVVAEQQGCQLAAVEIIGQFGKAGLQLLEHGFVLRLDGELAEGQQILPLGLEVVEALNLVLERFGALEDFLRILHIVPESRLARAVLQFFHLFSGVL